MDNIVTTNEIRICLVLKIREIQLKRFATTNTQKLTQREQWRTQKIFMWGGLVQGHDDHLVCIVCDITL